MTRRDDSTELFTKSGLDLDVDVALASLSATLMHKPPAQFLTAMRRSLDAVRGLVADLRERESATASETLGRFDDAMLIIADAAAVASVARNGHPDKALREAADTSEQEIEALSTELQLDRGVYDALLAAQEAAAADADALDPAGRHFLKKTIDQMRRGGVDRDEETRKQVRALRDELVLIGQEFGRNIIEDVRTVELDPSELDGLPDDYVRNHPPNAQGKVVLSTDNTDYVPFITYATRGAARERMWRTYRQRARGKNLDVLDRMLRRRWELAQLLGYSSFAALETENKMIGTDDKAASFIAEIAAAASARAERDYAALLERKRKDDPGAVAVDNWDSAYLSDRVCDERYGFSSQAVRPYLEYGRVKAGVLEAMSRLFGVAFVAPVDERVKGGAWHDQVEIHEVVDNETQRLLGRIYLDMHPREGKYKHYAQFSVRTGVQRAGRHRAPEGALLCNFPDPQKGLALLDLDQLRTFFHEFGHLMHHLLGGHTRWAGVSGVATEWDFVEAPSQLLEEWAWDWETLARFAVHHETGEVVPRALIDKARAADQFGKGLWARTQMFYAALSLEYHRRDPSSFDTTALMAELQAKYLPFPFVPGTSFQTSFGHLAGYSAVYYTYMWSLVIAKDLFSRWQTSSMADSAPARDYRKQVLEPGGSRPAAELCQAFLGRSYDVAAFRSWLDGTA
jgi:thimet oligopeptidase